MTRRVQSWVAAACIAGLAAISPAAGELHAAQMNGLTISQHGASYEIRFSAVVDVPAADVLKVLADYARLGKLSPVISSVTVWPAPTGVGERVRSVLKTCILLFCKEVVQVEDVTEPDGSTIVAEMVPGQGDFSSGRCVWRVRSEGDRTLLHYEATRTTAFWVPPLIGPWLIKQTMREHLESSVGKLESLARPK